jgi:hypothetical protein
MADYSQLMNLEKQKKEQLPFSPPQRPTPTQSISQSTSESITPSTDPSINHPIHRSVDQVTTRGTSANDKRIMDKPRGFYITERLNKRIDEAVRYYQDKHHLRKVDRSVVVTALLDNEANWTEEALDLLLERVIHQLTERLTNR